MQDAFEPITDIVRNPTIRKDFVEALPEAMKPRAASAGMEAIDKTIASAREILDALPNNEYSKPSRKALQRFLAYAESSKSSASKLEEQSGHLYERYTNTPDDPMSEWGHAMFSQGDSSSSYGKYGWRIKLSEEAHLSTIDDLADDIRKAADQFGIPENYESVDDLIGLANPKNIIDSAGAWDDADAVGWLWENVLDPLKIKGITTKDGAVVFDKSIIEKLSKGGTSGRAKQVGFGGSVSATDVNAAANAVKQEAQKTVMSLSDSATSGGASGEAKRYARETAQLFESNAQEPLRLHLEDSKVWGTAGEGQAAINKKWVELLGERGVLTRFQEELYGKGAKEYMSRRPYLYADTGKIKSWIESAGTTAGETRQAMVRDAIDAIDGLTTTIGRYHEMGPGQASQLEKLQNASQRMRAALADVDKTVSAANAIDEAAKAETKGLGKLMSPGTLAATGAILGGPLGAAAGLGIGALMRPTAMMGAREALESVAGRFGAKASGEARSWVLSAAGLKKAAASIVSATEKPRAVAHAAIPAAVAVFVGRDKDLDKAYTNRMDQLIQAKANPEQIIERLGTSSGALADFAPGVAGELVSKAQNAIDFLMSRAPSGTLDPTELMPGRKAAVSRVEMTRFARVWGAVEKPMSVLDDLRRGSATPDQIAALKAVHPETYQVIRNAVNDTILEVARRGGRIPIATRQQLDLLLDLGGAGEPAFAPGIADRIVAAREQQAQRQQKSQKAPKIMASVKLPQDNWTGTSRG
jgi:hypothetical protein